MTGAAQPRRCAATNKDGSACQAPPTASGYCFTHDPARAAQRAAARRAGGGRSRKAAVLPPDAPDLPLRTVADVMEVLAVTINQTRKGVVDTRVANAIGYLSSVLLRAIEGGEMERRIQALEEQLAQKGNRP
jgi:Family of unknown function (DUF5763)